MKNSEKKNKIKNIFDKQVIIIKLYCKNSIAKII